MHAVVRAPGRDPAVVPRLADVRIKPAQAGVHAGFVPGLFHSRAERFAHGGDRLVQGEAVLCLVGVRVLHIEPHAETGLPSGKKLETSLRLLPCLRLAERVGIPVKPPRNAELLALCDVPLRPRVRARPEPAADDDKAVFIGRQVHVALPLGNVDTVHFHIPPALNFADAFFHAPPLQ
jgi:hypothetical protein